MDRMNIVIVGHVDHGKSTVIGRLLVDTNSLSQGKLEQVKATCERNAKPFEYAFLLDALKDEQAQGITIDAARIFFKTEMRYYVIIDAPGHIEFLKNMISGASQAEAALLVIDAVEGIQENTRRHGYMLSMLGIEQVVVLVNKMDLVDYDRDIYDNIVHSYKEFAAQFEMSIDCFIPVSGREGDNIANHSLNMPWYNGSNVLEILDKFKKKPSLDQVDFRMMVQDVYKFTEHRDNRRIIAGSVDSGTLDVGDEVIFYPEGKRGRVKTIETISGSIDRVSAGYATGFTLEEQIYVKRGNLIAKPLQQAPKCARRMLVSIFWLGQKPLQVQKKYILKYGTARIAFHIDTINKVIDASNLEKNEEKSEILHNSVAECILHLEQTLAFDVPKDTFTASRFVIVDDYEICGGGIIRSALEDKYSEMRERVILRNFKWEKSMISSLQRAERYNQKSILILITGQKNVGKKELAKKLEFQLFQNGKLVYFLGIGSVIYGVDADVKREKLHKEKEEHFRRLGEIANILLDTGLILVITAVEVKQEDFEIMKLSINHKQIMVVWVGEDNCSDIDYDICVADSKNIDNAIHQIKSALQNRGILFKP